MRPETLISSFLAAMFKAAFHMEASMEALPPITEWFASAGALGAVVAVLVQFLKPHLPFDGIAVKGFALVVGALLGIVGGLFGQVDGQIAQWLAFGASAGVIAAGGKDLIKSFMGTENKEPPSTPEGGTLPR